MQPKTDDAHDETVAEVSSSWVQRLAGKLTSEGRRIEGGWPGTLSEARRLLTEKLASPGAKLTRPEFERLAKATYNAAKSQWLAHASRRPAPPLED